MQKQQRTIKGAALLALTILSLSGLFAPSAEATMRDLTVVSKLQNERHTLILKEKQLLQDFDDLQRQLMELQKRDQDQRSVDLLARDVDVKFGDIQKVRFDLKQIEMRLL